MPVVEEVFGVGLVGVVVEGAIAEGNGALFLVVAPEEVIVVKGGAVDDGQLCFWQYDGRTYFDQCADFNRLAGEDSPTA